VEVGEGAEGGKYVGVVLAPFSKMSVWAPIIIDTSISIPLRHQKKRKLTILEPKLHIVRRTSRLTRKVQTVRLDIVPLRLVPINHLSRARRALWLIVFTPGGGDRGRDGFVACPARDFAAQAVHVHVGLTAAVMKAMSIYGCVRRREETYPLGTQPQAQIQPSSGQAGRFGTS
jgi:hypothetical protein